jgi:hypothetical protein
MPVYAGTLDPPTFLAGGGSNDLAEFVREPTGVVNSIYDTMGTLRTELPSARVIAVGRAFRQRWSGVLGLHATR